LISKGIFRHRRDGRYELNSLAGTLRSDAPISMTWAAQFYGSGEQRERWTLMVDWIRTGSSVVPALRGKESFDYFAGQPELAELFNQTMTSVSELTDGPVVAGYDQRLSRSSTWAVARPTVTAILGAGGQHPYDLSPVAASAPARCEHSADRVRIAEGSRQRSTGGDAYILKNIIHDWPDVGAIRNVRTAPPRATVLLIELVIPKHDRDFPGKWVDLEMLLNLGARERTAAEYRDLLSQAGFQMTRVVQTASPLSVVEARAA
jgi:hypothetical protein